jgi:hypothetical protein
LINILPIIYALAGVSSFVLLVAIGAHIYADWPRQPKLKGIWRDKPLDDWDQDAR